VKIYLVLHVIPYEGAVVKGVFSSHAKAANAAVDLRERNIANWPGVDVSDETFGVEEWEVDREDAHADTD